MKNFLSSTKGKIIAGAATFAVIAGVIVLIILLNTGYRNIRVEDLKGTSRVTSIISISDAFKGQNLKSGDKVEVLEKSYLTLALDSDKHVVANELTKFSLEAFGAAGKDSRTVIHLEKGSITNEIDNKLLPSESYVVESPNSTMAVRGTIFSVNVFFDSAGLCHTVVEVEQGTVELTDKGAGKVKTLNAGQRANIVSRTNREPDRIHTTSSDIKPVGGDSGGTGEILTFGDFLYRYDATLGGIELIRYNGKEESVNIPAEIDGEKVLKIGGILFPNSYLIKNVTIPNSVTELASEAFLGCRGFTSIEIPDSVTVIGERAFSGCSGLTSLEIPNSVTVIGERAFSGCTGLTSVSIPDSITEFGKGAFSGCREITGIELPDSITVIEEDLFDNCDGLKSIEIPNSVTVIGKNAFGRCDALTSVSIPDSVTQICEGAFGGCTALESVVIPDSVTEIGDGAFSACHQLKSVTISNSITKLESNVFYLCSSLTSVTIPNGVTEIGEGAFGFCEMLMNVTIPDSVTKIGDFVFGHCTRLNNVLIPDSVTEIGDKAFESCYFLNNITLSNNITRLGKNMFAGCAKITSITIPDGVTEIGDNAFNNCEDLESISIPDSVTNIGKDAFKYCPATITYRGNTYTPDNYSNLYTE